MTEFMTIQEIVAAARRKLAPELWDHISGGAESETTLRRNRQALDAIAFRPRVLVDVGDVDTKAGFLGRPMRLPVMLAPIGSIALYDAAGAAAAADAARTFGIHGFCSVLAEADLAAGGAAPPLVFQLYARGDLDWQIDVVRRAKEAGFGALCVTVDSAIYGRRERDIIRRFVRSNTAGHGIEHQARLTWDSVMRLRDAVGMPLVLKGIATAEDAALAVEHGVEVIGISNHGGRQLDHGRGAIDTLDEIVEAAAGRAEIYIDSGFVRGSDVVKAIAMGAHAVGIGKLQCWALAAGGAPGIVRALEILEAEIIAVMRLLGVTRLEELGPQHLCRAEATNQPTELSAFHLPGEIPFPDG